MRSSFLYRFTQTCYDLGTALRGMSRLLFAIFCLLFMFALVVGLCSGIWWAVENGLDVKRLRKVLEESPVGPGAGGDGGEDGSGDVGAGGHRPVATAEKPPPQNETIRIDVRADDVDEQVLEFRNLSQYAVPKGTTISFRIFDGHDNALGLEPWEDAHRITLDEQLRPNRVCRFTIGFDTSRIKRCESVESRFTDEMSQKEFSIELVWAAP